MYLKQGFAYYRGGAQCVPRGPFLILLQPKQPTIAETCAPDNTFAVVRQVAMRQLGAWMMGNANFRGVWRTVSGSYGGDGLPIEIDVLPEDAVPLPRELYDAWNNGGGHNGSGSEAKLMRQWALETFK